MLYRTIIKQGNVPDLQGPPKQTDEKLQVPPSISSTISAAIELIDKDDSALNTSSAKYLDPSLIELIKKINLIKEQVPKKNIQLWFKKYFDNIYPEITQEQLKKAIVRFSKFLDILDKNQLYDTLSPPPQKNISFQIKGEDYIERVCLVLEKSGAQARIQAMLLDQLPNERQIKQAVTLNLFPICESMCFHGYLAPYVSENELFSALSLNSFKPQALVFLAVRHVEVIPATLSFFKILEKCSENQFKLSEKLILAKALVQCASLYLVDDAQGFITSATEVSKHFGSEYLAKIFENTQKETTVEDYIACCQSLIELKDSIRVGVLLKKHLPNIKKLNKALDSKKMKISQRNLPEEDLEIVLGRFKTKSEYVKFPLSDNEIQQLKMDYIEIENLSKTFRIKTLAELAMIARKAGELLKRKRDDNQSTLNLIAAISEVIRHVYHIKPHNTQILALLGLIRVKPGKRGRIAQIRTGEGKSLIDVMLATYHAFQDKFIDIITSSSNLAVRDQKKYAKFFKIFSISCSHICHRQPMKEHFNGQVLYGTNRDFEFSILRDELYNRGHRYTFLNGELRKRTRDVAIVDEVDNLFIDTALSSARIATASRKSMPWVYGPILNYVKGFSAQDNIVAICHTEAIKQRLKTSIDGKYAAEVDIIPDKKITQWLRSAKCALYNKKLNRDYVLLPKKDHEGKEEKGKMQVVIVDYKNTGRTFPSSRWQHGVHEFLELKEGLQPQAESLTVASISHPAFFNGYQELYGLSGTVGESSLRKEIDTIYNLDCFDVPPHVSSQRYSLPIMVLESEEIQFQRIIEDIQDMIQENRPILVLFDTIIKTERFAAFLSSKNIKYQLLDDKQKEDEEYIVARAGRPGTITLATNTAGRGTDIGLTTESLINGGLHVILAFYPANLRVEEQGIGRAARQGQPGTCRLILEINDEQINELISAEKLKVLFTDKNNFMAYLNEMRTKRVECGSKDRVARIQIDTFQHQILMEFTRLLNHAREELNKFDFSCLIQQLCDIKKPVIEVKESSDSNIQITYKQLFNLISQQIRGIPVDWKSFLDGAKQDYFNLILSKWAEFYDQMSDEELDLTPDLYNYAVFRRFHEYMKTKLKMYLENPVNGFNQWINAMTGKTLELISFPDSMIYAAWNEQFKQKYSSPEERIRTIDNKIYVYQPVVEDDFIRYEPQLRHQTVTKIISESKADEEAQDIKRFTQAIETGDLSTIKQLLIKTNIDFRSFKINGDPPLIIAVKNGHLALVRWLLMTKKASLKDTSQNGSTALLWAADRGHLSVLQWLIEEGGAFSTERTLVSGYSAFLCAAYNNHFPVMDWLFANGIASLDEKSTKEKTALMRAAQRGHLATVQWLIANKAQINALDCNGNSSLNYAAENNHFSIVKWLLESGASFTSNEEKETPLHKAVIEGHLELVEHFLNEVNLPFDPRGTFPVILAAAYGHLPLLKWLIKNGFSLEEKSNIGQTPFISAAGNNRLSVLRWILQQNPLALHDKDENNCNALMYAANENNLVIAKWLLEKGTYIFEKSNEDKTAMDYAKSDEMRGLINGEIAKRAKARKVNAANELGLFGHKTSSLNRGNTVAPNTDDQLKYKY